MIHSCEFFIFIYIYWLNLLTICRIDVVNVGGVIRGFLS